MTRPALLLIVLCAASSGCGSNNAGRIVGTWKTLASEFEGIPPMPGAQPIVVYEFTADGRFEMSAVVKLLEVVQAKKLRTGRYTLGSGDTVNFTQLDPPSDGKTASSEQITIVGDNMTIQLTNGKTRVFNRYAR